MLQQTEMLNWIEFGFRCFFGKTFKQNATHRVRYVFMNSLFGGYSLIHLSRLKLTNCI